MQYRQLVAVIALLSVSVSVMGQTPKSTSEGDKRTAAKKTGQEKASQSDGGQGWKSFLPAKGLAGWEITDFGGQGEVTRKGDLLVMEMGDPLTGINYKKKDFPKTNFEIQVEIQRIEGSDFLCGLTFPVGDEHCSLIAGGWGGGLVGLSSVDGFDASENSTTTYHAFDNGKWYKFRLVVDDKMVHAWIDNEKFVMQEREHHEFSTRIEVFASRPVGLCAFQSKVAVKNFRWRPLGKRAQAEDKDAADLAPPKASN